MVTIHLLSILSPLSKYIWFDSGCLANNFVEQEPEIWRKTPTRQNLNNTRKVLNLWQVPASWLF